MTPTEAIEVFKRLSYTFKVNLTREEAIEKHYTEKLEAERLPYRKARWEAGEQIEKLVEDPKYVEQFCTFKPGEFFKTQQDEWYEVVRAKLYLEGTTEEDATLTIGVRLYAYEIRWNGEKGRHIATVDQTRAVKVPETEDKRLLRRVKKRIIERLEGNAVPFI